MSEDQQNSSAEGRKLDRLIRASRSRDDFTRPSDASIQAYLLGVATSAQKDGVREALIRSAAFRREILSMAKDLASLTDPETMQAFESCPVPEVPALRDALTTSSGDQAAKTSIWSRIRSFVVPEGIAWPRLGKLAMRIGAPRVALVGAAAVVVLAFVSIQYFRTGSDTIDGLRVAKIETVAEIDPGLFVSNLTRSPDEEKDVQVLFEDHRLAAEAAFSEVVMLLDGEYTIDTSDEPETPQERFKSVMIKLVDESGSTFAIHRASLVDTTREIKSWILSLPSRRLRLVDMEYDSVAVILDPESDRQACIVFTYRIGAEYAASAVGAVAF
jgi:hypothetical protein